MTHNLTCSTCGETVAIDPRDCGIHVVCPGCQAELEVPTMKLAADDSTFIAGGQLVSGSQVAGFTIERRLGSGGMGTVYKAQQLSMHRTVALKILPATLAHDPGNIDRFQQEIRLQAQLDHPNIVPAFEAGFADGHYYLAMHYVDGRSLSERLASENRLGVPVALRYARQIAVALDYAWRENQLLHRDLKPQNIMVDRRDGIRLLDLGIAKCINDNAALTQSGIICGTPHYMSPEQARGRRDLDCRSDIYAFGATLYHLVTGSTPYHGETSLEVLHKHAYEPLQDAHLRNPEVTRKVSAFIASLMAKDREDRPVDWADVIGRIDHLLGPGTEVGIPAMRLSAPGTHTTQREAPAVEGTGQKLSLMMKGFIAGCLLWLVVIGTVFIFAAWGCVSCMSSCHTAPSSSTGVGTQEDLTRHLGRTYSVQESVVTLGPSAQPVAWLTEDAYSRRRVALRLRLVAGDAGGVLIWPDGSETTFAPPDEAVHLVLQAADDDHGPLFLVRRRVDGEFTTLSAVECRPDADGWYELMLTYRPDADLTLEYPNGITQTVADVFAKAPDANGDLDWPDRAWGVYADANATLQVEILDPSRADADATTDTTTE